MRIIGVVAVAVLSSLAQVHAACPDVLKHRFTTLQGDAADLCDYAGKVVLVVNTASYCGHTPQYKGLTELSRRYQGKGLAVLGFPSNDFGKQEPGSAKEIAEFCDRTYQVKFPMFEKSSVKGAEANPLFRALAAKSGAAPSWNFHKYLISRDGVEVLSFGSTVEPTSAKLTAEIERLLGAR